MKDTQASSMRALGNTLCSNLEDWKCLTDWKVQNYSLHLLFIFSNSARDVLPIDINFNGKSKSSDVPYLYPNLGPRENVLASKAKTYLMPAHFILSVYTKHVPASGCNTNVKNTCCKQHNMYQSGTEQSVEASILRNWASNKHKLSYWHQS